MTTPVPDDTPTAPATCQDISPIANAALPLTRPELQEFVERLNRGFNSVTRQSRIRPPETRLAISPNTCGSDSTTDSLTKDVQAWILATLDDHINDQPRTHANAAMATFLSPPSDRDELLRFFTAFAVAYEGVISVRSDLPSARISSALNPQAITIDHASAIPEVTKERLRRLAELALVHETNALILRLAFFAGSTAEEIGRYLDAPTDEICRVIEHVGFDVLHAV